MSANAPAVVLTGLPDAIADALTLLADESTPVDDRAALYATLHQVQLRINRVLRKARDPLVVHMETNRLREMGPLSVKATAFDVTWPCNEPGNWDDAGIQDEMVAMAAAAPEFFIHVPAHWEVVPAALGAAVHAGDPVARQIHRRMSEAGWRREAGRRLSLAVREAKEATR